VGEARGGLWFRHYVMNRKVWVRDQKTYRNFMNLPNPSSRTRLCGFTQALTEMSSRDRKKKCCWGVERERCVKLTTSPSSRLSRQYGIIISQPYRPPRPATGIALLLVMYMMFAPHGKHTHRPRRPVTGIDLYYSFTHQRGDPVGSRAGEKSNVS
jgi:hypothetical protein